jgi:hypothetical protein
MIICRLTINAKSSQTRFEICPIRVTKRDNKSQQKPAKRFIFLAFVLGAPSKTIKAITFAITNGSRSTNENPLDDH